MVLPRRGGDQTPSAPQPWRRGEIPSPAIRVPEMFASGHTVLTAATTTPKEQGGGQATRLRLHSLGPNGGLRHWERHLLWPGPCEVLSMLTPKVLRCVLSLVVLSSGPGAALADAPGTCLTPLGLSSTARLLACDAALTEASDPLERAHLLVKRAQGQRGRARPTASPRSGSRRSCRAWRPRTAATSTASPCATAPPPTPRPWPPPT